MNPLQQWMRCPEHIVVGDRNERARLHKRDDLHAIRGMTSGTVAETVVVQAIDDDISIARGRPSPDLAPDVEVLPVYSTNEGANPAVATKRIFLRLDEGTSIESIRDEVEALDFAIAEIPAYAPHSAWLEPVSGRVDEALSKLDRLRALPSAAHVEPQLLRPRGWKNGI